MLSGEMRHGWRRMWREQSDSEMQTAPLLDERTCLVSGRGSEKHHGIVYTLLVIQRLLDGFLERPCSPIHFRKGGSTSASR